MAGTPRKRERNKLDKRERIRDAAYARFVDEGFEAATIASIARDAGVGKGTVFLYASDKDDLLCLVMHERLHRASEDAFATLPRGKDFVPSCLHVFGTLLRDYGEHPALAPHFIRALTSARGPNAQAMAALNVAFLHRVGGLVRAGVDRGELAADVPISAAAQNVFALYFASLTAFLNGYVSTPEDAIDPMLRESLDLLVRGLRPSRA